MRCGLSNTLYPFQAKGVEWLAPRRRAYLGHRPGQGKTPMSIRAAVNAGVERPVVLCPAIAKPVWTTRWPVWGVGTPKVCTFGQLVEHPDLVEEILAYEPDLVLIDEVHFLSTTSSKRSRLALKIANRVERAWVLSGSPLRNGPQDLYPVLRAIWPDELRKLGINNRWEFLSMFTEFTMGDYGPRVIRAKNVPLLREIISRIMLRPSDDEVNLDLPPLRWEVMPLDDHRNVDRLISQETGLSRAALQDIIEGMDSPHVATIRRCLGALKTVAAADAIAWELDNGLLDKVVVFAYHKEVLDVLERKLAPYVSVRVDGSVSGLERQRRQDAFQHYKDPRVFLGQTQACGVSIDLWAAHECVIVEPSWTPDDDVQVVKRLHRIGQIHPVRARICVLSGTLDDGMARVRERKLRMMGEVVHN